MGSLSRRTATSLDIKNSGRGTSLLNTLDWYLKAYLADSPMSRCGIRPGGKGVPQYCRSFYRCVRCSVYRLAEKRSDLGKALEGVHSVAFLTLTQAHHSGGLREEWDALDATLRQFTEKGSWSRFKKRHAISGYSVTVEITRSSQGWNPHSHMLLAFSRGVPPGAMDGLVTALKARWVAAATRVGNEASAGLQALRMIPMDERRDIARYVTKQSLLHPGKRGEGQTPGDLLRLAHEGDALALALFLEYLDAAYKKPLIRRYGSLSPTSG